MEQALFYTSQGNMGRGILAVKHVQGRDGTRSGFLTRDPSRLLLTRWPVERCETNRQWLDSSIS